MPADEIGPARLDLPHMHQVVCGQLLDGPHGGLVGAQAWAPQRVDLVPTAPEMLAQQREVRDVAADVRHAEEGTGLFWPKPWTGSGDTSSFRLVAEELSDMFDRRVLE